MERKAKLSLETEREIESQGADSSAKVWRSEELFSGRREVVIEHDGARYRLLITKAGKLILNK